MDIRAAEISKVIRDQIANFGTEAQVSEVGQVLSKLGVPNRQAAARHAARLGLHDGERRHAT